MILNDAFTNIDTQRTRSTARELSQFADRGHQLLVFTRHEHVLPLFPERTVSHVSITRTFSSGQSGRGPPDRPRGADRESAAASRTAVFGPSIRPAGAAGQRAPPPLERSESRPVRREAHYDWVVQWDPPRGTVPGRKVGEEPMAGEPFRTTPSEETRLAELSLLDASVVRRLEELGFCTVRQFLEWNPDEAEQQIARPDVSAADIYRWQSNLSLQCHVGLSANDAALLVACGVDDPGGAFVHRRDGIAPAD